jgi:hypothetical protein
MKIPKLYKQNTTNKIKGETMKDQLKGKRIELLSTSDPYTKLKPGDRGTVQFIDDIGTVHVAWDNGSTLGLVPGEDQFRLLKD